MIMFRLFSLWLFLLAFVALVYDITVSYINNELILTAFGTQWYGLHPKSLKLLQVSVETYAHPYVWDPFLVKILSLPTWFFLGFISLFFLWIGQKKKASSVFVN